MLRTITNEVLRRSRLLPLWSGLLLFALTGFLPSIAQGQTYTWTGLGGNTDWSTANNWNPARSLPLVTDVLQFDSSDTVTNVPTQTINRLIITSGAAVILQAAAPSPRTLTINGLNAGTNSLDINLGGSLGFIGTNAMNLTLIGSFNADGNLLFGAGSAQTVTVAGNLSGSCTINISGGSFMYV